MEIPDETGESEDLFVGEGPVFSYIHDLSNDEARDYAEYFVDLLNQNLYGKLRK